MLLPGGLYTQQYISERLSKVRPLLAAPEAEFKALLADAFPKDELRREFMLTASSGALELAQQDLLQFCNNNELSHPEWISHQLTLILNQLADSPISSVNKQEALNWVRQLCVADRQFIILQWRIRNENPVQWLTSECSHCHSFYDFSIDWRQLPFKPAGVTFPFARAQTTHGTLLLRVPNGADQEWLSSQSSSSQKSSHLSQRNFKKAFALRLLISDDCNSNVTINNLTDDDCEAIELAVESVSPELPDCINTQCPECGHGQVVAIDLYETLAKPATTLLDEVHRIALHYHWSEEAILNMPKQRRKQYLTRLDRERGMQGAYS